MKAPAFDYVRAHTLDQALRCLSEGGGDARVIAGGQSLVPALNLRLANPSLLVDIGGLRDGLAQIEAQADGLELGALVTHAEIAQSSVVAQLCPLLVEAVAHVAHPAIRNRGTLGGSLAHADPSAELPACMLALDATIVATGPSGERRIHVGDFFKGVYETALAADEILTAVEIPALHADRRYGFAELARRRGDFAIVGVAAAGALKGGRIASLRLAYFGVEDRPALARASAIALVDGAPSTATLEAACAALSINLQPFDDAQASGAMRLHLAGIVLERAMAAFGFGAAP